MCDVMEEYMAEERSKALQEGKQMITTLVTRMYQNGDENKIEQLQNPQILQEMLKKYHLE